MSTRCNASLRMIAVAALVAALPCAALAQGARNSINLAAAAAPGIGDLKSGTVAMLEYERMVSSNLSVFGRASSLKYKWDDKVYLEDGKGTGLGLGLRYFPTSAMKGFYLGGAIAAFKSKWDWVDDQGMAFESRGNGDSTSVQWGAELGYRFDLGGGSVSLTPALNVGSWLGGSNSCTYTRPAAQAGRPCAKESELGFYAVVSLSLGVAF